MKTTFPFLFASALMSAVTAPEDAPTGGAPTPPETPAKDKKKQHTVTLFESDKDRFMEAAAEYYGPQASNPQEKRFFSTAEMFRVIWEVASAKRFGPETEMIQKVDDNGQPEFDTDGQPVMVESPVDHWEIEAQKVLAARGAVRTESKVSALQAQLAAAMAELEKLKAQPAPATVTDGDEIPGNGEG